MNINILKAVYFIGAGGIGMSALVRYFLSKGKKVGGYDRTPSELTEKLTAFLCKRKGIDPAGAELIPMEQYRQQQFDLLADGVRKALDMDAVYAAMGLARKEQL